MTLPRHSRQRAALVTAALGLAAAPVPIFALAAPAQAAPTAYSVTFGCLGLPQDFSVPEGVTSVDIEATGGSGSGEYNSYARGGAGRVVSGRLAVSFGETLTITAGCAPRLGLEYTKGAARSLNEYGGFGFSPGGDGPSGGGGSSGVRSSNRFDPVLVAAGGGGAGRPGSFGRTGGAGGDADRAGGDGGGAAGGVGGAAGGAPGPSGGTSDEGTRGKGGGGGGGWPRGGGVGEAPGASAAGGGGGGGLSYTDTTGALTSIRRGYAASKGDGSVKISFVGPAGLGVPQVFSCTGAPATYNTPNKAAQVNVLVVGAYGGTLHDDDTQFGGKGGAIAGILVTKANVRVLAGCEGGAGGPANYGERSAPGGAGGYGFVNGGSGGTGNHNPGSGGSSGGTGGCGGGGASGIRFTDTTVTKQLIAGGGGGCGGEGGSGLGGGGATVGGDGGAGGGYANDGGTRGQDGTASSGVYYPGVGGPYAANGNDKRGGDSQRFLGTLCAGGGGGGGGEFVGGGGGGATSGSCYQAPGGGGGGGSSSYDDRGYGLQYIGPADATGYQNRGSRGGLVIMTPIFD